MKKVFVICIVCIVLLLSIVQVVVSNTIVTAGIEQAKLQEQLAYYQKQNLILQEKVLTAMSLTTIASKAADLGFVEGKSHVYLSSHVPIAIKQ